MKYRNLGKWGLKVSEVALGSWVTDLSGTDAEQTAKENVIKSPAEVDEIMHTEEGPEEMKTIISATDYKGAKRTKKTKR